MTLRPLGPALVVALLGGCRPTETPDAQGRDPKLAPSAEADKAPTRPEPELSIDPLPTLPSVACTLDTKAPERVELGFSNREGTVTVEGTLRIAYAEGHASLATVEVRNGDGGGLTLVGAVAHPLYLVASLPLEGLIAPTPRAPLSVRRSGATFELQNDGSPRIDARALLNEKDPLATPPMKRLETELKVPCAGLSLSPGPASEEIRGANALDVRRGVALRAAPTGMDKAYFYAVRDGAATLGEKPTEEPRFAGPTVEVREHAGSSVLVRFEVDDQRVLAWVDASLVGKRTGRLSEPPRETPRQRPAPAPTAGLRVVTCRTPVALLLRGWEHPRRVGTVDLRTPMAILEEPREGLVHVGLEGVASDGADLLVASRELEGCLTVR